MKRAIAIAALLLGCTGPGPDPEPTPDPTALDADGDGFSEADGDCDDANSGTFPGAQEIVADGVDQDCDGIDPRWCFYDGDGDGFGFGQENQVDPAGTCEGAPFATISGDCDDADVDTYPGAPEVPDDGLDQDCNGVDAAACFVDADGDTWGSAEVSEIDPDGNCNDFAQSGRAGDCDDSDPVFHPDAVDPPGDGLDQDCNGIDAMLCYYDGDGDGFGVSTGAQPSVDGTCDNPLLAPQAGDCDDGADWINPDATEVPLNGFDDDCSGADAIECYVDGDGDGFGDSDAPPVIEIDGDCTEPDRAETWTYDCDDADPSVYPFAPEIAEDGIDQDCDGVDSVACWYDGDGDGWGSGTPNQLGSTGDCSAPNLADQGGDCDDLLAWISPDGVDIAEDGIDQDCNGIDAANCYVDADLDGVGSALTGVDPTGTCTGLGSYLFGDCNDGDSTVNPFAAEVPGDGVDNDCDGTVE